MSALTKAAGNMYPWVSHMHSHLRGQCPHKCSYCYVKTTTAGRMGLYDGPFTLAENTLNVNYGTDSIKREAKERGLKRPVIFIDHMNDLWADAVPDEYIERVLEQCCKWPKNEYVFQTKNPKRYIAWIDSMPPNRLLGCTIETTDAHIANLASCAPPPDERYFGMWHVCEFGERTFITVEPIMYGDMLKLAEWCCFVGAEFVNIGADSKGHGLPEPNGDQVRRLIAELNRLDVPIRQKTNLDRLLKSS